MVKRQGGPRKAPIAGAAGLPVLRAGLDALRNDT
jgi:hypothetical protein